MNVILILSVVVFLFLFGIWMIKLALKETILTQLQRLKKNEFIVVNKNVVISIYGIFIIITADYTGKIYGNENSQYWDQNLNGKNTQFRNPIKQEKNIKRIKKNLSDYPNDIYKTIIVFPNNADLRNITSVIPVIHVKNLFKTIMEIKKEDILTIEQVNDIAKNLKNNFQKKADMDCPYCSGRIYLKEQGSPYSWLARSDLYACTNNPKCKYYRR
ncbi:MAG: NERD domain-containing protein, partial [Treponema sp.]|nr:NERD domain-containing protein [Treponema sp.]